MGSSRLLIRNRSEGYCTLSYSGTLGSTSRLHFRLRTYEGGMDLLAVVLLHFTLNFPQTKSVLNVTSLLKLVLTQKSDVNVLINDVDTWITTLNLITRAKPIPQPTTPLSRLSFISSFQQDPKSFGQPQTHLSIGSRLKMC